MEKLADENDEYSVRTIDPFYKNPMYNKAVCDEVVRVQAKYNDFHLIFSAHGLPQKIVDAGDPYQSHVEDHIEVLKEKLSHYATNIKSINFAYQSKVGPMKWLTPSLDDMLKNFKGEKVIIYPISFIVDNSETVFELDIEYREIAQKLGIKEYKVCNCINDSDTFVKAVKGIISL
jgi:ferrochelatase